MRQISVCWLLLLAFAPTAYAQTSGPRVFIAAGAGVQSPASAFSEQWRVPLHAEEASFETRYAGADRTAFDVGGGVRVWRNIWMGAAFGHTASRAGADVSASLPHPFRFDESRSVQGRRDGLDRRERALHVDVMLRHRVSRRLQVHVFAGPTMLSAAQDIIDDVAYEEEYPYDSATFTGVTPANVSVSTTTIGVGGGVTAQIYRALSLGVQVRHAAASVNFETPRGRRIGAKAGGTRATIGAVFEF